MLVISPNAVKKFICSNIFNQRLYYFFPTKNNIFFNFQRFTSISIQLRIPEVVITSSFETYYISWL